MTNKYRFKSSLLGKQILQVTHGPQEIDNIVESNGVAECRPITVTIWRDADRYEAELLLRIHETNEGEETE